MNTTFPRTMGYGLGGSFPRGTSAFGPWVTSDPYDYPLRDQTMISAPSFPPFKFESRRARIDWRLLHGIDINAMMREVDLDMLEKIVNIVAFGDIEAEDTRHLTELNFIKIFRLSQMMIEYLLYVQDCLQSSNTWLQQDRVNMDKYVQASRLRIREVELNLKMVKRELRRSRKTIKTYELLAVLNDGKAGTMPTLSMGSTAAVAPPPPPPQPPQPQAVKAEPNPVNLAMEALLRKELAALGDRLSKATLECQTLHFERDELYMAIKDLEATVKARTHMNGTTSPLAVSRQNAEAMQSIQGLQDQLTKAKVEVTKLRNENEDLSEELARANTERRQLQDEKSRLLSELTTRPADSPPGVTDRPRASENLSIMLLEAERQKAALQDQLSDSKAEITALQKQLMKAMKDTALGVLPPPQPADDRLLRELELARVQLETELADLRLMYNEDVRQLHEEMEAAQEKAVEADRRLAELRSTQQSTPPQTGGFVKIVEERRSSPEPVEDPTIDRQRALLADYEAANERLNQQLIQLKGERNTLAGEVDQLRLQLQNRASPPQGDRNINRDWRTEEMERLKDERDAAQRRILDLEDALQDRDALIERLRSTIRDLQAQLDDRNRQQASSDVGPSIVKQQVKHFERLADPTKPPKVQASFSFGGSSLPSAGVALETPTSVRKPGMPEAATASPQRSPSPEMTIPEEPDQASSAEIALPSPTHPGQLKEHPIQWLRRIPRPNQGEAAAIEREKLELVAGQGPEAVKMRVQEEMRAITEMPYDYKIGEEERFVAMMPHEMAERKGVRSVLPHELEDLATARNLYTDQLLDVVDDELAQYGVNVDASALSDKEYLASMQMLKIRRDAYLQRYPHEVQVRAAQLREFLLMHIEHEKRGFETEYLLRQKAQLQQQLLQHKVQQQQPQQALATGGAGAREIRGEGLGAAAEAASKMLSTGASRAAATSAAPAPAATPAHRQLPSFPSRPTSQRSSATVGDTSMDELRSILPPAPGSSRPNSETTPMVAPSRPSTSAAYGRGSAVGGDSRHTSPEGSVTELTELRGGAAEQQAAAVSQVQRVSGSGSSDRTADSRQQSMRSQQSLPRSGAYTRPQSATASAAASVPQVPTPVVLSREAPSEGPERIVLGPAKPASRPVVAATATATAATAPGGNMNMSIRSVKYQDSDFDDDDDDVVPMPQPKPVRRLADEDEYALTEDEETQQDMGIESSEDFSSGVQQPRILMAPGGSPPRAIGPSRLGTQPTPATAQTRGWATDEPLQPAPVNINKSSQQASEAGEVELLESIQSFDNPNSQSIKRSPGAWGSPSTTLRKAVAHNVRDPSTQLSIASKQGWNEAITSFSAASGTADDIQAIQDITESSESVRPIGRFMQGSQRGTVGTSQPMPSQQRTIPRRGSFSSEISDIEYV